MYLTLEEIRETEQYKQQRQVLASLSIEQLTLEVVYNLLDELLKIKRNLGILSHDSKVSETTMRDEIETRVWRK